MRYRWQHVARRSRQASDIDTVVTFAFYWSCLLIRIREHMHASALADMQHRMRHACMLPGLCFTFLLCLYVSSDNWRGGILRSTLNAALPEKVIT